MVTQQKSKPAKSVTSEILDRMPPCELEAESAVIGAVIINPLVIDDLIGVLEDTDFYDDANRHLWLTLLELHDAGDKIDTVSLVSYLKEVGRYERIGGSAFIARTVQAVPRWEHATFYADMVRKSSVKRQLIDIATEALRDCYDGTCSTEELLDRHESRVMGIAEKSIQVSTLDATSLMHSAMATLEARQSGNDSTVIVKTGFADVDEILGGLRGGNLVILAARPGMGKSAFALNIAEHVAMKQFKPVLFVTLEMSADELADRLLSGMAKVNGFRMRNGSLSHDDRIRIVEAAATVSQSPLHVLDDSTASVRKIAAHSRRLKRKHGLSLVIVDYLQLLDPADKSAVREQQVAQMSRNLKTLARELDVPILCLSQLNRQVEQSRDNKPKLSHLRESGAIEQDADVVLFVHREEMFHTGADREQFIGLAEILVAKQRNGPNGEAALLWQREYTRFVDRAPDRINEFDDYNNGPANHFA